MATLTVCFTGICTHLHDFIDGAHRVVLIHETEDVTIHGMRIHSHTPSLSVAKGQLVSGRPLAKTLTRVSIRVANAIGEPLTYDDIYECAIPHVQELTDTPLVADRAVTVDHQPPAGIYFDVDRGVFSAGMSGEASAAILRIETAGAPRLSITPMDGGDAYELEFTDGAVLELGNVVTGPEAHRDADFLLHYRAFGTIPSDARTPTRTPSCEGLRPLPLGRLPHYELGPGCSNSQYP